MTTIRGSSSVSQRCDTGKGYSTNWSPTATIVNPAADVTVNPGGAVFFSGTGNDADGTIASYSWTFPGGNPGR